MTERLRWFTITGPMAWCPNCPTSAEAVYHADGDRDSRKAIAWARSHAASTGHEVIVERGQSVRIKAALREAPEAGKRGRDA